jgi:hypothetical protein
MMIEAKPLELFSQHMSIDVQGRVRNTRVPRSQGLLPVFEAIVNSIQSIHKLRGTDGAKDGRIVVTISRQPPNERIPGIGGPLPVPDVRDVEILDNGEGFTDANFGAFCTADTTAKASLGGKGIGRFSWLAVFTSVSIRSTYRDDNGKRERVFEFRATPKGIENHLDKKSRARQETCIRLTGLHSDYSVGLRKTSHSLADKILEHCFDYIVLGRCPPIQIKDTDAEGNAVDINILDLANRIIEINEPQYVHVGSNQVSVRHITQQSPSQGAEHAVHLCANHRVVETIKMSAISGVPNVPFKDDGFYPVTKTLYVSSSVLDTYVDPTRTRIDLPDSASLLETDGYFDINQLKSALGRHIDETYAPQIATFRQENFDRIRTFILTQRPDLVSLLEMAKDKLAAITSTEVSTIESELYRIQQECDREIRERGVALQAQMDEVSSDPSILQEATKVLMSQIKARDQVSLSQYVANRKVILTLLRKWVSRHDGGPATEAVFHETIFPRFKSNQEVGYDEHNLWLVDTSFSFYEFLTSDITFRKSRAPVDSLKRPDILAFQTGGHPYRSIAIIEIKRPERTDSDPVQQLLGYAQDLREGEAFTADGIRINPIEHSVLIDTYAIATISPKMKKMLRRAPGNLTPADGESRWLGHHAGLNVRLQVLDFSEFISRAEKQNFPFFKKLGLIK